MAFTFVSPAIPNTDVKVRWKEQYGSAGFNKKLAGITPAGIYRGLTLGTSGSDNTVTVIPDPTYQDHLAVYESSDGYSLTFRDTSNTTYSLALTDSSLLSQTVVLALVVVYEQGQNTTINFVAYTLAQYNALTTAQQNELVILGTVVNPAASNLITSGDISASLRTVASLNPRLLIWKPLINNPGFERAPAGGHVITGLEVDGWTFSGGNWITNSTDPDTGTRCIEFNIASTGTYSGNFLQYVGSGVFAGQQLNVQIRKQVITAATGGTATVIAGFTGTDGGSATELTSSFIINATDGSYQTIDAFFVAPSGALNLQYIGVRLSSAVYGTTGSILRIDNITALLEPVSINDQLTIQDNRFRVPSVGGMTIEDLAATSYSDTAATLYYKQTLSSASEGGVVLARKDLTTSNAPVLSLPGRLVDLGAQTIDTSTDSLNPRIEAPISTASGATYTLMMQSTPAGAQPVRIYFGPDGGVYITKNYYWTGSAWAADNGSNSSSLFLLDADRMSASAIGGSFANGGSIGNTISRSVYNMIFNNSFWEDTNNCGFINTWGRYQNQGDHWFDDFKTQPTSPSTYIFTAGSSGGACGYSAPHNVSVSVGTGTASYFIGQTPLQTWSGLAKNTMWMRVAFSGTYGTAGSSFGMGLVNTSNVGTISTNFIGLSQSDTGPLKANIGGTLTSTGFTPVINTWYYMVFTTFYSSSTPIQTDLSWWISTSENFDNGSVVTGSTFRLAYSITDSFMSPYFLAAGDGAEIQVDAMEIWSNTRSVS